MSVSTLSETRVYGRMLTLTRDAIVDGIKNNAYDLDPLMSALTGSLTDANFGPVKLGGRGKKEDLRPRLTLMDENSGEAGRYLMAPGTTLSVEDGQTVKAGDTILIVEAMKTMNPIQSPRDGVVAEVLVGDAQPVEFGEPLVLLEA
jgi:acetyl/propionyl-CoA carboxylase alpha subunit